MQAPQPVEPLRAGCSTDDEQLALVQPGDSVAVNLSLAGGEQTCYKVTVTHAGRSVTGYVLGEALPAVDAFVREQGRLVEASLEAQARQALIPKPAPKPAAETKNPAVALPPGTPEVFENFSGRTANGKVVSLAGLRGRVTLVTFWSPRGASKHTLESIEPLSNQFGRQGLSTIGVSMDPNPGHITDALDDMILISPQVADTSGLARRYNAVAGQTFVLDASHRIVAVGLSGSELNKKVRELLAAP